MQIHQVRGNNLREALERARTQVGEKAVVISQRSQAGGAVTLAVSDEVPRSAGALEALRTQARRVLSSPKRATGAPPLADTRDVERCMTASGCSERLVDRIAEAVAGRLSDGGHPLDLAAEELGTVFPVAQLKHAPGQTTVIALVGPTGVGKTTALAKLALRLTRAGRRVALATLDSTRVGAVEELQGYGSLFGCMVIALHEARELLEPQGTRALRYAADVDVILLDTCGSGTHDIASVGELAALARQQESMKVEIYRVLSAATSASALEATAAACGTLDLSGCIVTKLDETTQPAPVLEHAVREKLPIALLSNGPDLELHLHRASGVTLADLALRGRLAR
jgi:flagellar biosynthesis protein FlhF